MGNTWCSRTRTADTIVLPEDNDVGEPSPKDKSSHVSESRWGEKKDVTWLVRRQGISPLVERMSPGSEHKTFSEIRSCEKKDITLLGKRPIELMPLMQEESAGSRNKTFSESRWGEKKDVTWLGGRQDISPSVEQTSPGSKHKTYRKKLGRWIREVKSNIKSLRKKIHSSIDQNSFVHYQLLESFYDELEHISQQIAEMLMDFITKDNPTIGSAFPKVEYSFKGLKIPMEAKKEFMDFQVSLSQMLMKISLALLQTCELDRVTERLQRHNMGQQSTDNVLPSLAKENYKSSRSIEKEIPIAERVIAYISYIEEEIDIYVSQAETRPAAKQPIAILKNIDKQISVMKQQLSEANRLRLRHKDNLSYISSIWFKESSYPASKDIFSSPWTLGEKKLEKAEDNLDEIKRHVLKAKKNIKSYVKCQIPLVKGVYEDSHADLGDIDTVTVLEQIRDDIKEAIKFGEECEPSLLRLGELSRDTFKNEMLQETLNKMKTFLQGMLQHVVEMNKMMGTGKKDEKNIQHSHFTRAESGKKGYLSEPESVPGIGNQCKPKFIQHQKRRHYTLDVLSDLKKKYQNESKEIYLRVYSTGDNLEHFIIIGYDTSLSFRKQEQFEEEGVKVLIKHPFDVSNEALRFRTLHDKSPVERLKDNDINLIYECIQRNSSHLWKRHSNLTIITGDYLKSVNGKPERTVCIVFYCLSKGFIPLDEEMFPKELSCHLGKLPTDVREGYFVLGPTNLRGGRDMYNNPLCMGSNIGVEGRNASGTLGLFVDLKNNKKAFITCCHVLFDCIKPDPFKYKRKTDHIEHKVLQPSSLTFCGENNRMCGVVNKAIFKPNSGPVSVDAGIVEVTERIPETGHFVIRDMQQATEIGYTERQLPEFESGEVRRKIYKADIEKPLLKSGSSTGLTRSLFRLDGAEVRIFDEGCWMCHGSMELIVMKGQYEVESRADLNSFFNIGDSGSAVFIKDGTLVCVGMGIGITSYNTTIVTPIGPILDSLGLNDINVTTFS